jgi:phosphoadenosine phosphosulfate reductase
LITGLRAEQSENRNDLALLNTIQKFEIIKFNPLLKVDFERSGGLSK